MMPFRAKVQHNGNLHPVLVLTLQGEYAHVVWMPPRVSHIGQVRYVELRDIEPPPVSEELADYLVARRALLEGK